MNLGRIAAAAAIFTLVSVAGALAKPITTTADTNLRKSAGTDSEVLTLIPRGTSIELGKCSNGWCQATFEGKDGYVIARNVGMAPRPQPPGPPPADEEIVEDAGPPVYYSRPYVVGPPVYYGYGPYWRGYYGGWGWGRRW